MQAQEPAQWNPADLETLRGEDQASKHGSIHVKRTCGSEYPYEDVDAPLMDDRAHGDFHYSMARGGLSAVWGASILPNRAEDMAGWPLSLAELEPHYRAVLDFMPSTAVEDRLADLLPTYAPRERVWKPSAQAGSFLSNLEKRAEKLQRSGIHFGKSRMAVWADGSDGRHACAYCGWCLYGCPYSLVYSSAHTLDRLLAESAVIYRPGIVVQRFDSVPGGVKIQARDVAHGADVTFDAERVFVGTGVLPSAWLALRSLDAFDTPVKLLDSQYFIFPFFRLAKTAGVEKESLHSLGQAYLEIDDPKISRGLVHIEVFSYSDFLKRALLETPLRFALRIPFFAEKLLGRLLVLQCFMHSDDSAHLLLELKRNGDSAPKLVSRAQPNRRSFWKSIQTGVKLMANARLLGGMPVVPAIQFACPGRSYHTGGSFPMRKKPTRFETDLLGQLPDLPRVHFVDASVLPSIPATTITLTVMANAHRIATEAVQGETA
jgi:choline dehydrogenase-like flavoprotein